MGSIWLLLAFIVLVVWLSKKSKSKSGDEEVDLNSKSYAQGYWDGYRAHKSEASGHPTVPPHIANNDTPQALTRQERDVVENSVAPVMPLQRTHSMAATISKPQPVVINSAADKAKRDLQNINTTLYVASFLLVAAVALFVGTALPEIVRFIGVWFITVTFYSVGLILYQSVEKLRPAALAFVGTGLAVLPFTGIAMYNFVLPDAAVCWLITSIIGLVAFIFAATQIKSQVIAYLAIAFGVSLAASSVAVLHAGLIWYFVVLILFGSIMTYIAKLKLNWVPECFAKPIYDSNSWIVPLTIIASLFAFNGMTTRDYWIISLVSAFYYGAVAASSVEGREVSIFLTRFLVSIAALLMAYDFSNSSLTAVGFALSSVGIMQIAVSFMFMPKRISGDSNNETWLWIGFTAQLLAPLFVLHESSWAPAVSGQLFALLFVSFGSAYYLRRAMTSVFGTISLSILPIIWCTNVIQPTLENQWVALIFLILSSAVLLVRSLPKLIEKSPSLRPYLLANFALFTIEALMFTTIIRPLWGFLIWSAATLMVYGITYLERKPWASIVANLMIFVSVTRFIEPKIEIHWIALIFIVLAIITTSVLSYRKVITNWPSTHQPLLVNIGLFIIESLAFTSNINYGWGFAIWVAAALLVYWVMYIERQPWLSVIANVIISVAIWRFIVPQLENQWISLIFISFAVLVFAVRSLTNLVDRLPTVRPVLFVNIGLFVIEALIFTQGLQYGWGLLVWLIAAILAYGMTYVERLPWFSVVGNLMFLVSTTWLVNLVGVAEAWKYMVISWIVFVFFYGAYWLLVYLSKKQYETYFWWSAVLTAGSINLAYLLSPTNSLVISAGLGSVVVASAVAWEGWRVRKYEYIDVAAIVATVGLQRVLYVVAPDVNVLVYSHWWALVFAGLAYMYYAAGKKTDAKTLVYVSLSTISLSSGFAALGLFGVSTIPYETIFLIEHVLILVFGLVVSKKMFTTWGAVGIILAVLKLVGFSYILLALVALGLIGAAIFALTKQSKSLK